MTATFSKPFCAVLLFFFFSRCTSKNYLVATPQTIMQADIDFSNLSKIKGAKAAFLQYIDSNGVLLRPNNYPIVGSHAIDFWKKQNDSGFTLTWQPQAADVARSGDLGYTYGLYTLTTKDTSLQGTYVTIWKKQKDGSWKFVLDSGNTGVGKK